MNLSARPDGMWYKWDEGPQVETNKAGVDGCARGYDLYSIPSPSMSICNPRPHEFCPVSCHARGRGKRWNHGSASHQYDAPVLIYTPIELIRSPGLGRAEGCR